MTARTPPRPPDDQANRQEGAGTPAPFSRRSDPSGTPEESVGSAAVPLLALDIPLNPRDLGLQFVDVVAQLLDPQRVEHQLFQPRALANRAVFFVDHCPSPVRLPASIIPPP